VSKEVAVDGCTIEPQGIVSGGTLSITSVPSTKVKAEGAGVYRGQIQFTVSGANASGYDPGTVVTVGPATIPATALKVSADGQAVMRVDDQVPAAAMTGTIGGTPTPFVEPFAITDAGQTKVLAE
jgi:hypothetical protein